MVNIRNLEQKLRAVASARRLVILHELKKNGSMTVRKIGKAIRLSIAPASQHLRILKAAGIVEHKRRGKFVAYRLSLTQDEPIKGIIAAL